MKPIWKFLLWTALLPFLLLVICIHGDEAAEECHSGFSALIDLIVE